MIYEIVSFRFTDGQPLATQQQHIEAIGRWVRTQPGFLNRAAYYDGQQDHWVDLVTWTDLASAHAAMARSQQETSLADAMLALDTATMAMGHYAQHVVEVP
jgi:hypothetical protein